MLFYQLNVVPQNDAEPPFFAHEDREIWHKVSTIDKPPQGQNHKISASLMG